MAKTKEQSTSDPQYGFALRRKRNRPPIDVDPREWARRTQAKSYIQRVKKAVQMVDTYLLLHRKRTRGLSGHQVDAVHYFLDTNTVDSDRRTRRSAQAAPTTDALPKTSLKY